MIFIFSLHRKADTQLQWKFSSHPRDQNHKLNVHINYRAFVQEKVFSIVPVEELMNPLTVGYRPRYVHVVEQPEDPDEFINILINVPTSDIVPKGFLFHSRERLMDTIKAICTYFRKKTDVVLEWVEFGSKIAPQSDLAHEFAVISPLYVPMKEALFGTLCHVDDKKNIEPTTSKGEAGIFNGKPIEIAKTNGSVYHSGIGNKSVRKQPIEVTANPYSALSYLKGEDLFNYTKHQLDTMQKTDLSKKDLFEMADKIGLKIKKESNKAFLLEQ